MSLPLLAIRHAPTGWNRDGLIQGRRDVPLSPEGRAAAAGWRLPAGWDGARCLSSPLARAMETARILGLDPEPRPALIEMHWGDFEGHTLAALRERHGAAMAENESRGLDFLPDRGESPRMVRERLATFLPTLAADNQARPAVLVTHRGVLRALLSLATGWTMKEDPPERFRDSCAHHYEVGIEGAVRLVRLNVPLTGNP
jgi:probable phosphoglycerate mutase